jgi:hypothetical protein
LSGLVLLGSVVPVLPTGPLLAAVAAVAVTTVGSHGGLGGAQRHGFLVHPRSFADPGEIVGAEHLHRVLRGRLTDLGHPEPAGDHPADDPDDLPVTARARPPATGTAT